MTNQNFTCSINTPVSTNEAFTGISRVKDWWTVNVEGKTSEIGDAFTVTFGETFVDFRVTEATPGEKLVWEVTQSNLHWISDKTEWNGTKVVWEISEKDGETTVKMTHEGLRPGVECYENCEQGWTFHITESLKQLLNEGVGAPLAGARTNK